MTNEVGRWGEGRGGRGGKGREGREGRDGRRVNHKTHLCEQLTQSLQPLVYPQTELAHRAVRDDLPDRPTQSDRTHEPRPMHELDVEGGEPGEVGGRQSARLEHGRCAQIGRPVVEQLARIPPASSTPSAPSTAHTPAPLTSIGHSQRGAFFHSAPAPTQRGVDTRRRRQTPMPHMPRRQPPHRLRHGEQRGGQRVATVHLVSAGSASTSARTPPAPPAPPACEFGEDGLLSVLHDEHHVAHHCGLLEVG